jgi:hypothetical protein
LKYARLSFLCLTCAILLLSLTVGAQTAAEHNNHGIEAYNAGRFATAILSFERAYEANPDSKVVLRNLCNAHQAAASKFAEENEFKQAIRHLELAIGIDPENPTPLLQLGSYYLRQGQVSDAIFRLEEAIEIRPGLLDAHQLLGEAYYQDNDLASARVQWDFVLEEDPKRRDLQKRYDKAFREESVEFEFKQYESRHFRMSSDKNISSRQRASILTILERAYLDIGQKFGRSYPPAPIQIVLYSADQFSEATQLDAHIGALFDGKIRAPVTAKNGDQLSESELKRRLTHEYVHVVIRYIVGNKVPWWINEGLAETLSKDLEDDEIQVLQEAYQKEVAFSLADLTGSQLEVLDSKALHLAYCQAHAAVHSLWTRFGQRRMKQLLDDLAAGVPVENALQRHYRKSHALLDADLAASYR